MHLPIPTQCLGKTSCSKVFALQRPVASLESRPLRIVILLKKNFPVDPRAQSVAFAALTEHPTLLPPGINMKSNGVLCALRYSAS